MLMKSLHRIHMVSKQESQEYSTTLESIESHKDGCRSKFWKIHGLWVAGTRKTCLGGCWEASQLFSNSSWPQSKVGGCEGGQWAKKMDRKVGAATICAQIGNVYITWLRGANCCACKSFLLLCTPRENLDVGIFSWCDAGVTRLASPNGLPSGP